MSQNLPWGRGWVRAPTQRALGVGPQVDRAPCSVILALAASWHSPWCVVNIPLLKKIAT